MKKVMILGAGKGQIPIINLAKNSGYKTIVVSVSGDYPGFKIADKSYEVDVRDKEQVLEVARKEDVDGVIADQIDIAVPTVAFVTEKMGIPSIGYDCALKFTNKYIMRNECKKLNINVPEFSNASTLEEATIICRNIGLPIVIKPTDNAGSKGVSLIRDIEQLKKKFEQAIAFSKEKRVIIEKYIEGKEYVVEGFTSNFECTNLAIAERKYFEIQDIFVPSQTIFRPIENKSEKHILCTNKKLVEGFGLKFGVTHSEFIVENGTGNIYLVEVAARGGGVYISSDLLPLATGIDANKLLLDIVVGNKNEIKIENIGNNVSGYICFSLPKGIVKEIKGMDKIKSLPDVHSIFLDSLYIGMKTKDMTDKSMRMGPILIKSKNIELCQKTIHEIKSSLEINVETSQGTKGIIW